MVNDKQIFLSKQYQTMQLKSSEGHRYCVEPKGECVLMFVFYWVSKEDFFTLIFGRQRLSFSLNIFKNNNNKLCLKKIAFSGALYCQKSLIYFACCILAYLACQFDTLLPFTQDKKTSSLRGHELTDNEQSVQKPRTCKTKSFFTTVTLGSDF